MWSSQSTAQNAQQQQQQQHQPAQQQRTLGLTSAITLAGPKPIDFQRTNELIEALKPYNVSETEAELNHRYIFVIFLFFSLGVHISLLVWGTLYIHFRIIL